nr:hypothetical protein [Tanacetum cinerariifolium]
MFTREVPEINVPWVLVQYLAKKYARLRKDSEINGGHYVSMIAHNLGGKMRIKENDIVVKKERDAMLLKTGYPLDYALPILIHLGKNSGFTFDFDYDSPMVPPYPYPTTTFTSMKNASNVDVEHVEESLNDDGIGDQYGGDFEVGASTMSDSSMGNHEKQVDDGDYAVIYETVYFMRVALSQLNLDACLRPDMTDTYFSRKCSSCGALYTRDFCCSKGNVEDKILVPKLLKNYARCARCGHPVDGPYCQGCALLREKLGKDLVTYFQNFQNTFESSDDSTNVVNAPRDPFVVKKDHGVNSSQNPPHIDEYCPYLSLDHRFGMFKAYDG